MVRRLLSLITVLLLAMVVLAACGGDDEDGDQTRVPVQGAPTPPATAAPTTAASPQASPGASPGASPMASPGATRGASPAASPAGSQQEPPPPGEITMDLKDISFAPAEFAIPANTEVTVKVINTGVLPHTFTIEALGVDTGEVPPGGETEVTINAEPGTYEYICTVPGHKEAGMVGTLTVQ